MFHIITSQQAPFIEIEPTFLKSSPPHFRFSMTNSLLRFHQAKKKKKSHGNNIRVYIFRLTLSGEVVFESSME